MSTDLAITIQEDTMEELRAITKANGYENEVLAVGKIDKLSNIPISCPEISVHIIDDVTQAQDTNYHSFMSKILLSVIGYVRANPSSSNAGTLSDAAETLVHDIKRVLAAISQKYLNTKNYFFALEDPGITTQRFLDDDRAEGFFEITVVAQIHHTGGDFT